VRIVIPLLIACALLGCSQSETSETSGKETAVKTVDQVVLLDIQGLWGGTALWISPDGKATCRFVKPPEKGEAGLQEVRNSFVLSGEQSSSLIDLIEEHEFFNIETKNRQGVPDEARPNIYIRSGEKTHAVGKWANDNHEDFDPLYELLLNVAKSGRKGNEIHRGTFDWNWKPDGFPENKKIWEMTRPKIREE
jgi:hypothetical protein